ncbi:DUF2336 domain-containing protein [Agrobacterium tumefaciens]|uniref:DUF2336 domain-containing protein n=1 Tax=Agrobacterium tumefaciens TaxID=358 RepID=UPI00287C7540|nr:DUF2336 domain-containing protein [Agrobacterium tumefaciens]MDS7596509.1 DUF2336 domain-containing protein [Agrobacterium tumefaciens]
MATVTNFESVSRPSKSDLRQFAELFMPLFNASTDEAKREAIAALSQHPTVPSAVAFFIASQPIALAAPFLISSKCLDDETLIAIARTQGAAHARAIVRRDDLSPTVIDALVGMRHTRDVPRQSDDAAPAQEAPVASASAEPQPTPEVQPASDLEEQMRQQIRDMARHLNRPAHDVLGLRRLTEVQEALLVRFARERDARQFAVALADSLSSSYWLSERIMLDISGNQLAMTLTGLGMEFSEAAFVLQCFYPHLSAADGDMSRAEALIDRLDTVDCEERVENWRRADSYTHSQRGERQFTPLPRKTAAS